MTIKFNKNIPFFEEVNLNDIINTQVTPFYLYSQKIITQNYENLKKALKTEIFFSIKANSNQAILKIIKNCGAGADVVSIGELERSIKAGFDPNKIIFEGVGKSKQDIEFALQKRIHLINVESVNEIILVNQIGKDRNQVVKIGIRINPDIDGQTLDKISTGKKTDKFGISLNKLSEVILLIRTLDYINLKSISCHVGSQINDILIFEKIFLKMKEIAEIFLSNKIIIENIDLGGGFGIDYEKRINDVNIINIGKLVASIFHNTNYKISFEPGRYLVARAGIIITKILTLKENGGINFLITDAGMQTLIRPAMYNSFHHVSAINDLKEKNLRYTVAGPICESSDIIAKDIFLPKQKTNNYLVIHDVGAYGAVMASNYNSRGLPAEILVHKDLFSIIHNEEKISNIIRRDLIPNWL